MPIFKQPIQKSNPTAQTGIGEAYGIGLPQPMLFFLSYKNSSVSPMKQKASKTTGMTTVSHSQPSLTAVTNFDSKACREYFIRISQGTNSTQVFGEAFDTLDYRHASY